MINKNILKKEELLNSNFNNEFRGRLIFVRPICNEQITDKYVSWLNDKSLNQYLEVRHQKQNLRTVTNYINSLRKKPNCDMFVIFKKKDRQHIGNLTITSFNHNNSGELSFGLMIADEDSRRRGIGGEMHLILLEFAFSFKEINRVTASAASDNKIACRTLESVGYKVDGISINEFPLKSGEKCNVNHYIMLRDKWNKRKQDLKYLKYIQIY